ncbi:uncharacterized protein [Aquarana catesbeiana]|uniref:uncharacterized protein n=2 Tax=Aquarana catesbeiana TaxID=8400 RepID=UPI003CCA3BB5
MADVTAAALLEQLRAVAATQGADWLQAQVAAIIQEDRAAPSGGGQETPRGRRSRPPQRFSPDSSPVSQRPRDQHRGRQNQPPPPSAQQARGASMGEVQRSQRRGRSAGMGETSATLGSPPSARRRRQEQPDGESLGSASGQSDRRSSAVDRGAGQGVHAASSPTPARGGTLRSTVSVVNRGERRTAEAQHSQRNRSPSTRPGRGSGVAAQRAGREQQRRPPAARAGTSGVQAPVVRQEEVSDRSEGELSGSERDEDQGQASAVDSGRAADRPSPVQPGDSVPLVWILGHSFVFWGAKRADVRPNGRQLGIPRQEARVRWIGLSGMMWNRVRSEVHKFARWDRAPDVLVLHVGGNDMGVRSMRDLIRDIKCDVLRLQAAFPGMVIVWSDMVGRRSWRWALSDIKVDRARVKVNKEVSKFVMRNGGVTIRHRELEVDTWRYLRSDGVHLNDVGTDLWALGLQEGVQRALRVWRCSQG